MMLEINDKNGTKLKTAGKYCEENIIILPKSELINDTVNMNGEVTYTVSPGYCGINTITLHVNVPVNGTYPNAEEVAF